MMHLFRTLQNILRKNTGMPMRIIMRLDLMQERIDAQI